MRGSSDSPAPYAALARSVLEKNLQLRRGERVTIEAWTHSLPWAVALAREARRRGAYPLIQYEDESSYWDSVAQGETRILGTSPAHERARLSKTDVFIHMWGPGDRVRLSGLPARQGRALVAFNMPWYAAAHKAGLRGARLEVGRPFPSLARLYGVDEKRWREEVVRASLMDPARLARAAAPISRALQKGRRVRLTHENGTDLTLGLAHRKPTEITGRFAPGEARRPFRMMMNVPAGQVRVALDEKVAEGKFVGNRTDYFDDGTATGVTLEFAGGRLRRFGFETGGSQFRAAWAQGGRGRDLPGILGIGLNPYLHDTPQLEDLEAGAIMVSVGTNEFFGGRNRSPMFGYGILAGARVEIDGKNLALPRPGR